MSSEPLKFIRSQVTSRRPLAHGWELSLACGHKMKHPSRAFGQKVQNVVCWECEEAAGVPRRNITWTKP